MRNHNFEKRVIRKKNYVHKSKYQLNNIPMNVRTIRIKELFVDTTVLGVLTFEIYMTILTCLIRQPKFRFSYFYKKLDFM